MRIKNILQITILLLSLTINDKFAQIENSVYSMLGVGQLSDNSFGINRALGGTGIAFQSGSSINYLNPASYLGIATSSHFLEAGLYGMYTNSKSSSITQNDSEINFDYLSVAFYFSEWWAASLGLTPFSYVDYQINSTDDIEGELVTLDKYYEGSGGLNRLYFGNSFQIFDGLAVGLNLAYIVGPITKTETANSTDTFSGYQLSHELTASSFYVDYGLQYTLTDNDMSYTLGAIYGAGQKLNTSDNLEFTYDESTSSLSQEDDEVLRIPEKFGVGLAIADKNHYRIGLDYEWGNWSNINFSNENLNTRNSNRYSLGIEYNPKEERKSGGMFNSLIYRLGANYKESYLEIKNTRLNSYGLSFGLGIPYDDSSIINLSLEYGKEGTTDNGLILNNYLKFYASITLHEFWSRSLGF